MNNQSQIGGLRIFRGHTYRYPVYQRAGGLGDIFKNLFQSNKATLGNIGKSLLTEGIKTVGKVISDVTTGKSAKQSLRHHASKGLKRVGQRAKKSHNLVGQLTKTGTKLLGEIVNQPTRKRKHRHVKSQAKRRKRTTHSPDIFD